MAAISKAQQKATAKYVKNNYDRLEVKMPKGKKAELQAFAAAHSESVNSFVIRAIDETMQREGMAHE